ncbi:hypothetical protein [Lactobacillus crispatus]|jgi:hypothetical protein|uniref:Uncharacterized protein n=1 Tax=Lactobacillus crispatus TaxID=47770 RepID=A0A135ZFY9_9LACO|nr:hypothetical protein [Lactobacillus crispatus]CPR80296.1 Uncharacterised protein [Chlamydia trachomatis]DAP43945.1 MAG TPA: hypothetical protein [Caudoviricetes sp.]KWU07699.1 hypothetical protein AEL97_10965 [Lactobacillus crispatus]KWX60886.1 hypothetical protein AEL94_01390 [Lactobacillus crispatus]KXI20510.1 hypothetical protein HMPREF3209_00402 [Lactobacillus crispatus]
MFSENVNEKLKLDKEMEDKVSATCMDILNGRTKHFIIVGLNDDGNQIQIHHGHGVVLAGLVRNIQREIDEENDHTKNANEIIKMMQKIHKQDD